MDSDDVRVAIYRSFIDTGRPPMPIDLAAELGAPLRDVEEAIRSLAEADVLELIPGTSFVWLAHPFSAAAAPFRVTADDRVWDAICIWDALGIIAMLGDEGSERGQVQTWCPDCGEPLALDVEDGEVAVRNGDALLHFAVPAMHWWDDIGFS